MKNKFSFFLQEQNDILESLNSPVKISKVQKESNLTFLYFNINDKEFRIVLQKIENECGIFFEQKINNSYTYEGMQNNLTASESLSLFSTLKTAKIYLSDKNFIFTDSKDKLRLYLKILKSIKEINFINYNDVKIPYVIAFSYNGDQITNINSLKFNKWKIKKEINE